jgi:glycosyltransferase involved in cell wall biosynthesis
LETLLQSALPPAVSGGQQAATLPGLAFLGNVMTPYRANLHRAIAAGIPELKLHTLITHGVGDFDWRVNVPPEIHVSNFSIAEEHSLDNPLRRPYAELRKAGRLIRYFKAHDVRAVVFGSYRYIAYMRLMDYCYRAHIPFFVNLDSNIRSERQLSRVERLVKRNIYRWWIKRASGIFSMGELGDQYFLEYGADPRRLYRLPYWPDFDAYSHVDEGRLERFRRKFGLDPSRRHLLFSGRLVPEKRVDLLIDAFTAIAERRPDWDLLIVGDGVLRDELQRRVPESLRSRVIWTGFIDGLEIVPAYHAADVLVLPSDHEPWALVVQEAMAAGMTVVASDVVGAAHEIVTDGVSGRIFARGNCESLRLAIDDVTRPNRIATFKEQAISALDKYRERVDPVAEIRRALCDVSVLSHTNSKS